MLKDDSASDTAPIAAQAWTRSTDIEKAWREEPDPLTPEEFIGWLHRVVDRVRLTGYIFHADGTHHYSRLALKAREMAQAVWCRDETLPDLPNRIADTTAELQSLWEWAVRWTRPNPEGLDNADQDARACLDELKALAEAVRSDLASARCVAKQAKRIGQQQVDDELICSIYRQGFSIRETAEHLTDKLNRRVTKGQVEWALKRRGGAKAVLDDE